MKTVCDPEKWERNIKATVLEAHKRKSEYEIAPSKMAFGRWADHDAYMGNLLFFSEIPAKTANQQPESLDLYKGSIRWVI